MIFPFKPNSNDNLNKSQIPIFVISLASQTARRKSISLHLEKLGLEFHIVEGVDGRALSDEQVQSLTGANNNLPIGHIGCYLSHINIYRYLIEHDIKIALILEDDARISPKSLQLLKNPKNFDERIDYLFLDSEDHDADGPVFYDRTSYVSLGKEINAFRLSHGPSAMHSYLISRDAALKRVECAFPITHPIDTYKHLNYSIRHFAVISPKLAWVSEHGITSSTYERNHSSSQLNRRFLRKSYFYYQVRDFFRMKWWSGRRQVKLALASGRLPPTGDWHRLPSGKEIVVD